MAKDETKAKPKKASPKRAAPKKPAAKAAGAKAKKTTASTAKPEFRSKSDFVRSMPGVPAKQVVEAGKAKGLTFSDNLVYAVRAAAKKADSRRIKTAPKRTTTKGKGRRPSSDRANGGQLEAQLRSAIAELGLARARAIFADVEKAFAG